MLWRDIQDAFVVALRNPKLPPPTAVASVPAAPSGKRFNVYRNNVAVSLTEALAAGYPVVKQLVGEEFFAGMARVYVSEHLPTSPVMLQYGTDFPEFIETFAPAASVPFLADVARVEQARHAAYHAEDRDAIGIEHLHDIACDELEAVQLLLHPSLNLLASRWPVISIWHIHQTQDDPAAEMQKLSPEAETALIVRPRWDIDVRLIPDAAFRFFSALQAGEALGTAAESILETEAADVGHMLQLLFVTGSVVGLSGGNNEPTICATAHNIIVQGRDE
ncbi:MAG: DNA-binding domain-containing protein [Pseudomonadota bacterium]